MIDYIITILIALIVSFISTPLVKTLAFKFGAVDIPKDSRRMHKNPIALLGGFAIILGFLAALIFNLASGIIILDRAVLGLLAGIFILIICGFLDDKYSIRPFVKFIFQLVAAIAYVVITDLQIDFFTNPLTSNELIGLSPFISYPLTIIWIVGITNAINFIDGLDGLAAGISSISAFSLFFISLTTLPTTGNVLAPVLTAALAGSSLGFLPFNFNPAKIFMGETGAAFLGFTLATISVQGLLKSYAAISLAIPVLIIGLPIFDVLFAIIRRVSHGVSPALSDRNHLHHKLIDMGLSQRQSVLLLYIASAILGLCGFVFANKNIMSAVILLILLPVFVFACAKYFVDDKPDSNSDDMQNTNSAHQADSSTLSNDVKRPPTKLVSVVQLEKATDTKITR